MPRTGPFQAERRSLTPTQDEHHDLQSPDLQSRLRLLRSMLEPRVDTAAGVSIASGGGQGSTSAPANVDTYQSASAVANQHQSTPIGAGEHTVPAEMKSEAARWTDAAMDLTIPTPANAAVGIQPTGPHVQYAPFDEHCSVGAPPEQERLVEIRSSFKPVHAMDAYMGAIIDAVPTKLGDVRAVYAPGSLTLTTPCGRTFVVSNPEMSPVGPLLSVEFAGLRSYKFASLYHRLCQEVIGSYSPSSRPFMPSLECYRWREIQRSSWPEIKVADN